MTTTANSPAPPTRLTDEFASLVRALSDAVFGFRYAPGMTHALHQCISRRISQHVLRIRLLIAALQAGTVRTRTSPAPGLQRRKATAPEIVLPRRFGWLRDFVPGHRLPVGWMETLLADPEMAGLLAASPRLVRTMKPFCRMLGVEIPKVAALRGPSLPGMQAAVGPKDGAGRCADAPVAPAAPHACTPTAKPGTAQRRAARWGAGDARLRR